MFAFMKDHSTDIPTIEIQWSGIRPRKTCNLSNREIQERFPYAEMIGHDRAIETQKHTSRCQQSNLGLYLFLRYHPINAKLGWPMFALGSPIQIS